MHSWYEANTPNQLFKSKLYRDNHQYQYLSYVAKRRAVQIQAIPIWYEKNLVDNIYKKAKYWSKILNCELQVDHIIPLNSKTVCGLHCWHNLQLLHKPLNGNKNNKYQKDW
jgi:hypothetical protein